MGLLTNRLGLELGHYHKKHLLKFSYEQVNQIGVQLITLLEQVHSVGYVHADLKPDNILVGDFG